MMPPFGLAPLGFLEVPPPELIALAAEAHFAFVTLRTRPAVPGGAAFPMRAGDPLARACRRRSAETGVAIGAIEQVGLARGTDVASLREMLEVGAELGATRVVCSGDDPDLALVVDRFAQLCCLAAEFGMEVALEFMPFRAVQTLEQAHHVVTASGAANARVCLDTLHLIRSGGSVSEVRDVPPQQLGLLQLSDAPAEAPAPDGLAEEARERRLLPGHGALPLADIIAVYPDTRPIEAEVPMAREFPQLDARERARLIAGAMRALLAGCQRCEA